MDSRERFSAVAGGYDRYRPGYPDAMLDWMAATTGAGPGARVADLGCGTGIFTRILAGRGYDVAGIEPNEAMLAQARAAGGGATYQRGDAAATGLPGGSVTLCTAAQAFHWFELAPTLAELARVLVPGGWSFAIWNLRTDGPFNDDYERVLLETSREYKAVNDSIDPRTPIAAALPHALQHETRNDERLGWEMVLGRSRSASYVHHGVPDRERFVSLLGEAFDRHAGPDGKVPWAMRTVAIAWS